MLSINRQIIDALASATPPARLFNQYTNECEQDFYPGEGAELRRERLLQHISCEPRLILLTGDADASARLTGIPFTSEDLITQGRIPRVDTEQITVAPEPGGSWKSSLIWNELDRAGLAGQTIIWAAQPFYSEKSIRTHERNLALELNFGLQFLEMLLKAHKGVPIIDRLGLATHALECLGIKPAATIPSLRDMEQGTEAMRKALRFFTNIPKHKKTRDAGKPIRGFFASCRSTTPSPTKQQGGNDDD